MAAGPILLRLKAIDVEAVGRVVASPRLARRNFHSVVVFRVAENGDCNWSGILPQHYGASGLTMRIHYTHDETVAGKVIDFRMAIERIGIQHSSLDGSSFGTQISGAAFPGTTPGEVEVSELALAEGAQMDDLLKGELFTLNLLRVGLLDTAQDVYVTHVDVTETV